MQSLGLVPSQKADVELEMAVVGVEKFVRGKKNNTGQKYSMMHICVCIDYFIAGESSNYKSRNECFVRPTLKPASNCFTKATGSLPVDKCKTNITQIHLEDC